MVKDECYDVELYDWTKVDITQEDQKALVNAYFEEPDEIQGMKLLETKCFKWWHLCEIILSCWWRLFTIAIWNLPTDEEWVFLDMEAIQFLVLLVLLAKAHAGLAQSTNHV